MAQMITDWVMSCGHCIKDSRINHKLNRFPLQNPIVYITAPEYAMQIALLPELPPSGGSESIVTATDVFSRYLFAYTTPEQLRKLYLRL